MKTTVIKKKNNLKKAAISIIGIFTAFLSIHVFYRKKKIK